MRLLLKRHRTKRIVCIWAAVSYLLPREMCSTLTSNSWSVSHHHVPAGFTVSMLICFTQTFKGSAEMIHLESKPAVGGGDSDTCNKFSVVDLSDLSDLTLCFLYNRSLDKEQSSNKTPKWSFYSRKSPTVCVVAVLAWSCIFQWNEPCWFLERTVCFWSRGRFCYILLHMYVSSPPELKPQSATNKSLRLHNTSKIKGKIRVSPVWGLM